MLPVLLHMSTTTNPQDPMLHRLLLLVPAALFHACGQPVGNEGHKASGYSTEVIPLAEVAKDANVVVKGAYYLLSELTKGGTEE